MSRLTVLLGTLLLALALALPAAWARQAAPQRAAEPVEQQPDAATEPPRPIEEGEIPTRAEHLEADLRRIELLVQPAAEVVRIESELAAREVEMVALHATLDSVDPNQISPRRLEELRLPWLLLQQELSGWLDVVGRRFDQLQEERDRMRQARALWELTAEAADAEAPSPVLRERVGTLLTLLADVEARIRQRRNDVGAIAGRITSGLEEISDSLSRLDALAVIVRTRLFSRDAVPLWRSFGPTEVGSLAGETMSTGREWFQALLVYTSFRLQQAIFLGAWFFILLWGTLWLRRHSGRWGGEDQSERFRKLIGRPFSLALAFALVASRLIFPYPLIGSAADVLTLLAIVPTLRLGSAILPSALRRHLYKIAALTVLGRVAAAGTDVSIATRLLVLFVGGLGFLAAATTAVRGRARARAEGGWARTIHVLLVTTAAVLAVAVFSNVLGWVQLSAMLTDASISSLFVALGWMVVVVAVAVLLPPVIHGPVGEALPSLRRNESKVVAISVRIAGLMAAFAWLQGTMSRFEIWAPLRDSVAQMTTSELTIGSLTISTVGLLGAMVILLFTWLIARLFGFLLAEEAVPRLRLKRGSGQSLVTLVNYSIFGIGIMMAASAIGLTGTQLAVVVGALSVGIGFGLQTIVNNFVSGLILIFERPIMVGDTVQTVDHFGKVERIGIRASTIRSFDGAEIIVPNGDLISKEVINWTRTDEIRRVDVLVGVAYGTDPEAVLEILLRVATEHAKVRAAPEPKAQMIGFGESSLDFRLRCWTTVEDWVDVASDLHVAINRELKAAGIKIPFPQRDLHVIPRAREGAPEAPPRLDTSDNKST
jgi:small-conductance mechanosensitive channel